MYNPGKRPQTVWGSVRIMYNIIYNVVVVVVDDDDD
jgi:hypothetical protein